MENYYKQVFKKDKIVLHHTAGSHNPHWVLDGWNANKKKIGTAWVIGGMANPPYKDVFDGDVVNYYDDKYWSHHIGIPESNYHITKPSIGIELCNYGYLVKNNYGTYLTYVGTVVPPEQVVSCDFRGFSFYEAYTEAQIIKLKALLLDIAERHTIDLHEGLYKMLKNGNKAFEYQTSARSGRPGLWTHGNFRKDKWDCSPQGKLIDMILSL